ncbi:MAG: M1 family aminopeptidase [Solirubrobacteraceae bacterium]
MPRRPLVSLLLALAVLALAPAPARAGEPDAIAPAYDVSLQGFDRGLRWTGRETIAFTNPGAAPLDRIWVRLWGNGVLGCHRTPHVRIANAAGATPGEPSAACSAVPLRLAVPLAPGARGSVSFDVDIRVPRRSDRFGRERHLALLSNAIPALAHLEGGAWRLDPYVGFGEAWTYPAADWTVRLDAPPGIAVAAPGVRQADGSRHLADGRDYSFAAGRLRSIRATVAGVQVTVWGVAGKPLAKVMRIARRRLPRLSALFGPYGWPDLQIVLVDDVAMEHTGLIMTPALDYVVTHELAHEWWYALIGGDQAQAPWLDEAFASFAEEAAGAQRVPWCRRSGPLTRLVTRDVAYFDHHHENYGAIYSEGACLLDILRKRMGPDRFADALRGYALANRYGWSTAARFRAAMDAASPVALGDLWRRYRVQ